MKSDRTMLVRRKLARDAVTGKRQTPQQQGNSLWGFIDSVASGVKEYFMQHLDTFVKAVEAHSNALKWLLPITWHAALSLATWVINDIERKVYSELLRVLDAFRAWVWLQFKDILYVMAVAISALRVQLTMLIRAETQARIKAVARAEAQAKQEVRALHQAIEREAATAYKGGDAGHLSAVSILSDAISAAEPALKHIVGRVVQYAIDLAEVDNPILRFLAGKLISYLIDKLGIDKIAGEMLGSLVLPSAHLGAPKGLPEVVGMLCARINALEQFNATFMADGGPEILQAGEQWRDETTTATGVALLAFFGAMVAEPDGWASAVNDTVGAAIYGTIDAVSTLIRG